MTIAEIEERLRAITARAKVANDNPRATPASVDVYTALIELLMELERARLLAG